MLETLVFGKIVGRGAAAVVATTSDTTRSKLKEDLLQPESSSKNNGKEMKAIEKIFHELYPVKNATEVHQEKKWKINICCRNKGGGGVELFRRKIQEDQWSYLAIQKDKPLHHLLE